MPTDPPDSFAMVITQPAPSLAEAMREELNRIAHAPRGGFKLSFQEMALEEGRPVIRFCAEPLPSEFGQPNFDGDLDATNDAILAALERFPKNGSLEEFRAALGAFATEIPEG